MSSGPSQPSGQPSSSQLGDRRFSRWRLCLFGAILVAPVSARATLMVERSLHDQVTRADVIVVGVVIEQRSYAVGKTIMTDTTVRVEQTLMGEAKPTVAITQLGGRIGSRVVEVVGDAVLEPGQRLLLFTHGHRTGKRYLVGMARGAMVLEGEMQSACGSNPGALTTESTSVSTAGQLSEARRDLYLAEVIAVIEAVIRERVSATP